MGNFLSYCRKKYYVKAYMFGLDGSGKTTLLMRMKYGKFYENNLPTIGMNVETITLNNQNTEINIWDFGGSEKIAPLMFHYFTTSSAYIFVTNIYDRNRLSQAKERLKRALDENDMCHTIPILVFANNIEKDKDNNESLTIEEIEKGLNLEEMCSNQPWIVIPVCSKTGIGIQNGLDWILSQLKK